MPQGRCGRVRKISPTPGFDPRTVQPVASRRTDCTIPALCCGYVNKYKERSHQTQLGDFYYYTGGIFTCFGPNGPSWGKAYIENY